MKERIKFFFVYALFWLVFFIIAKVIFLTYHYDRASTLSFVEILKVFIYGSRLDFSSTGYILLVPGLLLALISYFNKIFYYTLNVYTFIILFFITFITVADIELYKHWGFKLDATPLMYIGSEAAGSGDLLTTILLVAFWLILFAGCYWMYLKKVAKNINSFEKFSWIQPPTILFLTACMILPIRGSLGVAPMNVGFVYFSKNKPFANHAAINTFWNVNYALYKLNKASYPDNYFNKQASQKIFDTLYSYDNGTTKKLINVDKPNVLIIILESYTSKMIEPLGGIKDITPNFNKLSQEGVLFTNMFSSGDRTDKGIVSVLNGYPAQTKTSIIKFPRKTSKLPFLNTYFKQNGYYTQFSYGYDINYANFQSYLNNAQFDGITSKSDFPSELDISKWGIHDHYVFERVFAELDTIQTPFFHTMMTLSSHEPFDVPMDPVFEGKDEETQFLNAAYYTDKSFGEFIEKAKKSEWWANTLIIAIADHGSRHPNNNPIFHPDRFKIPMLWLGGALAVRDTTISKYGNQTDLANTLLGQFDAESRNFKFSNNLMSDSAKSFSTYLYNDGFGYIDDESVVVYDNVGGNYIAGEDSPHKEFGKAYLQMIYSDFSTK